MITAVDAVLPIISLTASALLTVPVVKIIRKTRYRTMYTAGWFLLLFLFAAVAVANLAVNFYALPPAEQSLSFPFSDSSVPWLSSAFMIDGISIYMAIIFTGLSIAVLLYSSFFVDPSERPSERYYAIMLMLTAALIGAAFSGDLLTLFIFWEAAAAGSGFLMLYRKSRTSINAALKYLVMIILASAFVVFGLSIVYGTTGTLNFVGVRQALMASGENNLLVIAFIFIVTGYAIEAAIVPFHFWLPDAYTAAPSSSAAFLSGLIDQGSYYVLIRVLLFILTPEVVAWPLMLAVMAAFTMIVGNLFALIQNDVKRLIANICVADVGYNLVAITSTTAIGLQGNLFFFLIGGLTTALAFMTVGIMNHYGFRTLNDFSGIGRKLPFASLALLIATLSFAGVPPLGGFIAKTLVFTSAIQGFAWLAVIGVIMSVVQTAYLFRLINQMYGKKPKDEVKIKEPVKMLIPIFILVGAIVVLGLFPDIALNLLKNIATP
jgi:proton-translocating NADH-quinone oxidoreductase chain N